MTGPTSRYGGYPPPRIPVDNIDGSIPGSKIDGDIADENVPGVRQLVNNVANKIFGWEGGERSHQESANALETIRVRLTAASQSIEDLWSAQPGPGALATDDFNRAGSNLGDNWSTSYSSGGGYLATRTNGGGEAYWVAGGMFADEGQRTGIHQWVGEGSQSATPYQDVSLIFSSPPNGAARPAATGVICRVSGGSYSCFYVTQGDSFARAYLFTNTNGANTSGQSVKASLSSIARVGAGSVLRILAGDKATNNPNVFRAYSDGLKLFEWSDDLGTNANGRGWGFYTYAENTFGNTPGIPGSVYWWQGKDQ